MLLKINHQVGTVIDMLSIYETHCDLMIGETMFYHMPH